MLLIKVLFTKKACKVAFQSAKNEEMSFLYDFIFVFIQYFNGAILLEKSFVKWGKGGVLEEIQKGKMTIQEGDC